MNQNSLKIAQIAPLWIPVPPHSYGGIELMLSMLTEELVERGNDVTLFASGDSKSSAKTIFPTPKGIWLQHELRSPHAIIPILLKEVAEKIKDFEIIHNHFDFFSFPLSLIKDRPPILTTVHRPLNHAYMEAVKNYPEIHLCAISEDQKKDIEENGATVSGVVYNGIDTSRYIYNETPEDYLLYIGRLNEEKGVLDAIDVARETNHKLVVAGNVVGPKEWNFFMSEVQHRLDQEGVKFVGRVGFEEKINLFKNAKGVLFPIDRREPFGLVMIESMACGTPVIGYRKGSVPEVIDHEKTGYVVDTIEQMIDAVKMLNQIKRSDCRKRVEENFTLKKMVDEYQKIYNQLIN